MDKNLRREIENMRIQSGRKYRDYHDHENGMNSSVFLLFQCFLAFALFICAILFPKITEPSIPKELKAIPDYVSVNYTIEDVMDLMDSIEK